MTTENLTRESSKVMKFAGIAIVLSTVVNVILWYIGSAADAFNEDVIVMDSELDPVAVVFSNVTFLIIGTIAYLVVDRLTENTKTNFRNLAGIAYLLSLLNPLTIKNIEVLTYIFLILMHTVSAVVFIYLLVYKEE